MATTSSLDPRSPYPIMPAPMRPIDPGRLAPLLSPYLMGGYHQDAAELVACAVGEGRITGELDIVSHFAAGDGFHLTVPLTMIWVAQLAIIYGCLDSDQPTKKGEAYLRAFEIECRKPVRKRSGIHLALSLEARRDIPGHRFYRGEFDVDHGHFEGHASFILPIAAAERTLPLAKS